MTELQPPSIKILDSAPSALCLYALFRRESAHGQIVVASTEAQPVLHTACFQSLQNSGRAETPPISLLWASTQLH